MTTETPPSPEPRCPVCSVHGPAPYGTTCTTCGEPRPRPAPSPEPIDTDALREEASVWQTTRGDVLRAGRVVVALCDALDEARRERDEARREADFAAECIQVAATKRTQAERERDEARDAATKAAALMSEHARERGRLEGALSVVERQRDEARAETERVRRGGQTLARCLDEMTANRDALRDLYSEARREVDRLREALAKAEAEADAWADRSGAFLERATWAEAMLDEIPCPGCSGRKSLGFTDGDGVCMRGPCSMCEGSGKHPAAQAALAKCGDVERRPALARLAGALREVARKKRREVLGLAIEAAGGE